MQADVPSHPKEGPDARGCPTPSLGAPSPCSPTCISKPETLFHSPAVGRSCPMLEIPMSPVGAGLKPAGISCIATPPSSLPNKVRTWSFPLHCSTNLTPGQ